MIFKTIPISNINFFFYPNYLNTYYVFWIYKICKWRFLYNKIKKYRSRFIRKLNISYVFPKNIQYYHRLYYATKPLTWKYSRKKNKKFRRIRYYSYIKFMYIQRIKKIIKSLYSWNTILHRVFLTNYIARKIHLSKYFKIFKWKRLKKIIRNSINKILSIKMLSTSLVPKKKKKKFSITNYYDKNLLKTFKEARHNHWFLTSTTTLNKRTYCKFINNCLIKQRPNNFLTVILLLQQLKFTRSWKHAVLLYSLKLFKVFSFTKNTLAMQRGDIIQLIKGLPLSRYRAYIKKKARYRLWKHRKQYNIHKYTRKILWMQRKKKISHKVQFNHSIFLKPTKLYHYDVFTGSVGILKTISWTYDNINISYYSYLLKLTKWRFKA